MFVVIERQQAALGQRSEFRGELRRIVEVIANAGIGGIERGLPRG